MPSPIYTIGVSDKIEQIIYKLNRLFEDLYLSDFMRKRTYDKDKNRTVDDSERLGNKSPSEYVLWVDVRDRITLCVDNGEEVIRTGKKGAFAVKGNYKILSYTMLQTGELTGSIEVDIQKTSYANYPNNFVSICGTNYARIIDGYKNMDEVLDGWDKSIAKNDCLKFIVNSCNNIMWLSLVLEITPNIGEIGEELPMLIFEDNFNDNYIDPTKWDIHIGTDINIEEKEQQLVMSGWGTAGVLQGKINNNFTFINHEKSFKIKYKVKIFKDDVYVMVKSEIMGGVEPFFLRTKTEGGIKYLYVHGVTTPIPYNFETIVCEMIYTPPTGEPGEQNYEKRFKFDGDTDWKFSQKMYIELTQPQGLYLQSVSLTEQGQFPGDPKDHDTRFDDIEVYGTKI